jgi:hypothetical protein
MDRSTRRVRRSQTAASVGNVDERKVISAIECRAQGVE